jgi:AraC family transcriptional regulator, regulatory protein of adaptative response / DNA-3-methyladenine glycosylase II
VDAFAAVVTTGIYCRPGCSARPRPDNVRAFQLAASAEAAGYRACLRCRPYRWPLSATLTAPELVCRAVRLVLEGALDSATETELGARLGVSARHLRRLFATHLGVTPDGLARSARVHFARRLLDDTDLTITEIAFAAGFGSVRQFNRACRDVFRDSPGNLRSRRHVRDRLVADGGLVLRLPFHGRLDWGAMLSDFAARAIPGVEAVCGDVYRRTVVVGRDPGVLELGPGDEGELRLRAHLPHWEGLVHVVQRARGIASLDLDAATGALADDSSVGPLRPRGSWDGFEAAVVEIIAERRTAAETQALAGRLVSRAGAPVPGLEPLGLTHTFPSATALAQTDLADLGLTAADEASLCAFAAAVEADAIRLDRSVALDDLVRSITGIGLSARTAHSIALRTWGLARRGRRGVELRPDLDPARFRAVRRQGRSLHTAAEKYRFAFGPDGVASPP